MANMQVKLNSDSRANHSSRSSYLDSELHPQRDWSLQFLTKWITHTSYDDNLSDYENYRIHAFTL